jgi:hypothetical protein
MRFPPLSLVWLALSGSLVAGPVLFSVTPVAAPPGYTIQSPNSINNLGQVSGIASGPGGASGVFVSTGPISTVVLFPSSPQGFVPQAAYINNFGQIAGWAASTGGEGPAFFGTVSGVSFVPLPATDKNGGTVSGISVRGISDSGQFVGTTFSDLGDQAVVGASSGITQLPYDFGLAINNLGQVMVQNEPTTPPLLTYILTGGAPTTTIPGNIIPTGLNEQDEIVGPFANTVGGIGAFIATSGGITVLPPPPGFSNAAKSAFINNNGIVVGDSSPLNNPTGLNAGWIWDPVNGTQLLTGLVLNGWNIIAVDGINDLGQILAEGQFTDPNTGVQSANTVVLLTPVATPEPGTFAMTVTAAVFLVVRFARRKFYSPMSSTAP